MQRANGFQKQAARAPLFLNREQLQIVTAAQNEREEIKRNILLAKEQVEDDKQA